MIEELDLDGNVRLKHSTAQIAKEYQGASIVVLSSRYEGLPMILLEAQAFGLPIVSFKCKCGPQDVITDGKDGYLVAESDIDGMAERIVELIKNDTLRREMGKAALVASNRYSEEEIMKQWVSLFNELWNGLKRQ